MKKFYVCAHCGNVVEKVSDRGVPVVCCGEKMQELVPNSVEASGEKHKPVVSVKDGVVSVNVGSADHPMVPEHSIEWVYVELENGGLRKDLKPSEPPKAEFFVGKEKPAAVYAYCNLHGLWVTEV